MPSSVREPEAATPHRAERLLWLLTLLAGIMPAANTVGATEGRAHPEVGTVPATVLWFDEREPGVPPYRTRMIVVRDFMRMDDGDAGDDFVLFDRRTGSIHSVSHEDRTVLDIPARPVVRAPPYELVLSETREPLDDAPRIAGRVPEHLRLRVNGSVCYETVVVPGLLDDVVAAMRAYRRSLAGEQARTLDWTPVEMQTPCVLAHVIFHPARHLAYGFPIQHRDYRGYVRVLQDYREQVPVDAALFRLPTGYRHYTLDAVRAQDALKGPAGRPAGSN